MSEEKKYEIKPGTFSMFKVDADKKKKESSPDFNGTAKLSEETIEALRQNGGMLRLSGWGKMSNAGKVYVSGFIEEQKEGYGDKAPQAAVDDFMTTPKIAQAMENGPLEDDSPGPAAQPKRTAQQTAEQSDDLPFILTIPITLGFILPVMHALTLLA